MQHVAQTSESDIKLDSEINNVPKVGNSSTPSSPRSPPCSPPCTPPDTPPDRFSDSFQCLSDSSESGDEDISEVDSFIIDTDELTEEAKTRISSKLLLSSSEEGGERTVDPETQARLQSLLKAAGINKFTAGDGKQLADPEVLRRLTSSVSCALDEAAAALTRMRSDSRQANKRALIKACTQGNVTAVRKLLKQGISVNETSEEGESLLSLACSAGYYELAQVLLAMHASVEDRGSKGDCTPLMEASSSGFVDIVRLLLAHGADVNAQSATGNTPLMYACAGGHVQTVRVLLDAGANVEDHNENGHTPLMEAASAGHVEVAKMLLKHGAGINTHSNEFKESALTLACYKGHLEMVNFLLQAGADQEHKTDEMHTALMEASMDGHVEVAKLLLDSGAQVNMPTDSFESPLTLAACGGHVDLAILLIGRGANIEEVNDEGYTPLMEAAREGHEDMVAVLLQRGACINAQTEETQETALTLACCGGFIEVADYLIKHGADIELGASTPLMEAAQEGHIDLVRYLLEADANVHAHTQTADTALTYACENGHTDVADLLLQYGANLEHESEGGRTPLMKACRAGHLCTVQFLVSKNADINRRTTNNDHTPLSLACAGGHFAIVQFLLDHGADMLHKLKDNSTMLIEAAKGGHTNVVQLLLDYPDMCTPTSDNNLNLSVSSSGTGIVTNTTATATQTSTISNNISSETTKNNTVTTRSNMVVCSSNNTMSCANNENQNKVTSNVVRQMATALPKTAVRKLSRDPRLVELLSSDEFLSPDGKKITSEECKKEENQISKTSNKQLYQQHQKSQQVKQNIRTQKLQEPQQTEQHVQLTPDLKQLEQQFEEKLAITSAIDQHVMQSQLIVEELQRVEQEMKDNDMSTDGIPESVTANFSKELSNCAGVICSMDPVFSNSGNNTNGQVIPLSTMVTIPTNIAIDSNNLPPPPPLIPISEVLQSTAISDRPKAKPSKKEGKILRKQHLHAQQLQHQQQQEKQLQYHHPVQQQQQQQQQLQTSTQQTLVPSSKQMNNHEEQVMQTSVYQAAIHQQQSQVLHLKHLAQINSRLHQQVIKNQQLIDMHQQQQQQNLSQQSPQLIGSGTITVATASPNLAEILNHQELIAQIQQMDTSFAKTFPDFAEKTIEKEMRAMQQMMSCDVMQESLHRCHFLTSITEDEVSLEDVTNGTITIEEKRLCDVRQPSSPSLIEAHLKSPEKFSIETQSNSAVSTSQGSPDSTQNGLSNLNLDQQNCIQLFSMPVCSTVQQSQPVSSSPQQSQQVQEKQQNTLQQQLPVQSQQQYSSGQSSHKQKQNLQGQSLPQNQQQIQQLKQSQFQQQNQQKEIQHQKQKPLQFQQQKQLIQQKQQIQQQHFQQMQKFQPQKQQSSTSAADSLSLNSQARQELHRHLNEMKAIAQSATAHQNQNTLTKCVADSTVSHAATSTQTTVATIKKKIPFDDAAGAFTKLGIGKKMRTVNPRVPPNAGSHVKDDGSNSARVPSTNASYNQNSSMDVDSETESNHDTALTLACAGGHDELVELLLSRGADIEHRDKKGFTPLILAATAGHEKVVDLLLNHNADIEAQSERTKDTPLSLACSGGRYEVVELLIARGANKEHRNVSDYTPLSLAASGGYVNIIKLLLTNGAEINSRTGSKLGISPLMLAAMNGHTAAVKMLLDMGSDINAQIETNRNTALTLACFQGRHEVVSLLLERKANVEHRAKTGLTPLMEAASGGYVEVGRVLLEKGADVNAPPVPSSRDTALTIASDKGHVKFVELLISKNAQVEVKNKKGNSPMWLAANGGHLQVIELLYNVGADIDSQDNRKVSCLMAAFRKGHLKTVTWMVDRVHQFPSDQEMTRYISTINDKDLLDKCQACMKIIRASKEQQAQKANEFATILLEELDLEKSRAECKKQAAARRKERKKNKKLQKIYEKRRKQETENNEEYSDERKNEDEDMDEEYQPTSSKEKREVKGISKRNIAENVNRRNNIDIEEGDSGIDANSLGSCSSNEVKISSTERQKEKKNKKQSSSVETSKSSNNVSKRDTCSLEKFNDAKTNKKKKKKEKESNKDEKVVQGTKDIKPSSKITKTKITGENNLKSTMSVKSENKTKQQNEDSSSNIHNEEKKKVKKENMNLIYEANQCESSHNEKDDFEAVVSEHYKKKKQLFNHEESTIITASNAPNAISFPHMKNVSVSSSNSKSFISGKQNSRRGEEEWKEVVRKCLSPTFRVKKVSVPLNAISRVIGRGGCNINAIRSTTGAHIEIEKQSKGQGERIITIRGPSEVTKQAHTLIIALIDDPELDITQILPKPSKPVTSCGSWEKTNTNSKGKTTVVCTNNLTVKPTLSTQSHSNTFVSTVSNFSKVISSSPTTVVGVISSASYTSSIRTSINMTRPSSKANTVTFTTFDKKPNHVVITSIDTGGTLASVPLSNSKTTMSYTNAIMMSTNKTSPKVSMLNTGINSATVVSQTFAAKVSETVAKEKEPLMKPPIAPPPPTSTSIFIRPPPTASAPPSLPIASSKPPFSIQSPSPGLSGLINQATIPTLPVQLSQQLSHPPPPLPVTIASSNHPTKLTEIHTNIGSEEPSPVSAASEYSLFNNTFSKVTQQSMWGRDSNEESNSQKGMNFASVVTASGSPCSSVGSANTYCKFLDVEPPIQVDASKAPGYRGTSMCSPNLQKPPPAIRSSAPSNVASLSPPGSLSFAASTNSMVDQISTSVTAPIARPTSVPSSVDNSHTFAPRALFHDKIPLYAREQTNSSILKMVQSTVSNDNVSGLLSQYHSLSYSQPQATTTVSMSRLNPRAPDFSTTIKPPTVTIPTNQLPPTHQPPPIFNQQSLAANFLSSQHPPTVMANSNMISFPLSKYGQQTTQRASDTAQTQWSLMSAATQHTNYPQNDIMNFATPTTLNNLIHPQNNDMLSVLENTTLTNNPLNISPNLNANLMAGNVRAEERKIPPKPIGTERAWRTERERSIPIEQDPNSWMIDQKMSWNPQIFRNSIQSNVTTVQTAPAPSTAPYSCLQVPDEIRPPILDNNVYQSDHFNNIMQNTVLPNTLPPLLPHMNISQVGSAPILQSFNQDLTHPDAFKMESGWDPNRLCMSDLTISTEKSHPQQSTQPPNWTLSWNH